MISTLKLNNFRSSFQVFQIRKRSHENEICLLKKKMKIGYEKEVILQKIR